VFVKQRLAKIFHRTAQRIELELIEKLAISGVNASGFCASQALSTITADISNNRFFTPDPFVHIAIILANTIVYTSSAMLRSG
jgi:hypothetical protein